MTQLQKQPPNQLAVLQDFLLERKHVLQELAPDGVNVDKIIKMAIFEAAKNEQLRSCTPQSMFMAIGKACELGLAAGGVLHRASLVPIYSKKKRAMEADLWVEYTGLMDLVRRSGEISSFVARVVHESLSTTSTPPRVRFSAIGLVTIPTPAVFGWPMRLRFTKTAGARLRLCGETRFLKSETALDTMAADHGNLTKKRCGARLSSAASVSTCRLRPRLQALFRKTSKLSFLATWT